MRVRVADEARPHGLRRKRREASPALVVIVIIITLVVVRHDARAESLQVLRKVGLDEKVGQCGYPAVNVDLAMRRIEGE